MAYDLTDRLDAATKAAQQQNNAKPLGLTVSPPGKIDTAIAAPPTLGGAPLARSEPAGTLTGPATGIVGDFFERKTSPHGSGLFNIDPKIAQHASGQTQQPTKPGFDQRGIITADSAKSVMAAPMERSGGISGGIDMQVANAVLARENATRQQMIDSQVGGGMGKPVSWQDQHGSADPEKQRIADSNALLNKWDKQYQNQQAIAEMGRNPRAAQGIAHLTAAAGHDETLARGQDLNHAAVIARQGLTERGQDLNYDARMAQQGITARGQDLSLQRGIERNNVIARGQDVRATTAADRIASDEAVAGARIAERGGPSLAQQRGNVEIDAARNAVAGLTPDEIKRKTAKTTNTGRENPDFDPTLERAVTLSGRRKVGADDHFDQRQQGQHSAGNDGDVTTRFKADQAMAGHALGKQTELGTEVLDRAGKIIGHYR